MADRNVVEVATGLQVPNRAKIKCRTDVSSGIKLEDGTHKYKKIKKSNVTSRARLARFLYEFSNLCSPIVSI